MSRANSQRVSSICAGGGGGELAEVLYTRVNLTSDQSLGTDYTALSWQNEYKDDLGAFSSGNPTRLTVPAGYTKVNILGFVVFTNATASSRFVKIVKNGTTIILTSITPAASETGMFIETGLLSVIEGDYFELYAKSTDASYYADGNSWGGPCWFEMFVTNEIPMKRTKLILYDTFDATSSWQEIPWSAAKTDNAETWSVDYPKRITIPSGYTKARLSATLTWLTGNDRLYGNIRKNNIDYPIAFSSHGPGMYYFSSLIVDTGWIDVTEGDYFICSCLNSGGTNLMGESDNGAATSFEIELAP